MRTSFKTLVSKNAAIWHCVKPNNVFQLSHGIETFIEAS